MNLHQIDRVIETLQETKKMIKDHEIKHQAMLKIDRPGYGINFIGPMSVVDAKKYVQEFMEWIRSKEKIKWEENDQSIAYFEACDPEIVNFNIYRINGSRTPFPTLVEGANNFSDEEEE